MTQDELQRAVDAVLGRASYHTPIVGEDGEFLTALLRRDPAFAELVGPGLDYFTMSPLSAHGFILSFPCRTLVIHRTDGMRRYWPTWSAVEAASCDERA